MEVSNMEGPMMLGKVKGHEPEHFVLITMHADRSGIKHTSFFTEADFREFCRINGRPGLTEAEIDSTIENARKHEV
jgi:hypothetical protein